LEGRLSPELISQLASSAFALKDLNLSDDDNQLISTVYMTGLRAVFASYAILIALYFFSSLFVEDYGLGGKRLEAKKSVASSSEERENESQHPR
jgi:hypothetical protein